MWAWLLVPLKQFAGWIVGWALGWLIDIVKNAMENYRIRKEQEERRRQIVEEIRDLDKEVPNASKEQIDEIRKKKIALEESLINGNTP